MGPSILPVSPFDRREEVRRIVADAILEHELHPFDVGNVHRGISLHDDQVRAFAQGDRAGPSVTPEEGKRARWLVGARVDSAGTSAKSQRERDSVCRMYDFWCFRWDSTRPK